MTIITKPITEKKEAKLILPLVENDQLAANASAAEDVESQGSDQDRTFIILKARAHRIHGITTLVIVLIASIVAAIGVMGGAYLYRQYLRSQVFKGWCTIPYKQNSETAALMLDNDLKDYMDTYDEESFKVPSYLFKEKFEVDMDDEYEKIDVPDFKDGRDGRFIHDFNTNTTGIIDRTGNRCFIMPLNRKNVLPPKSLLDLIQKMWKGYYKVNVDIVKETMRVVTPPISDTSKVGEYISKECYGLPIYKLEQYVGGVVKRSADLHDEAKFAQFSGNGIMEFDIINFHEVEAYENSLKQ
ncbi:PREDICTED: integral membrane protein 2B [Nicrophorus vespilloides]|uniref:Integral membrane protein 2 n=1 Tax=Nicrophorus vespilloides TaxID=110193 RepID=A0ABM1NBY0_NICVS|nr:PREDICTED: integral membrane protein 2B [Nicrophorus vespilloides]